VGKAPKAGKTKAGKARRALTAKETNDQRTGNIRRALGKSAKTGKTKSGKTNPQPNPPPNPSSCADRESLGLNLIAGNKYLIVIRGKTCNEGIDFTIKVRCSQSNAPTLFPTKSPIQRPSLSPTKGPTRTPAKIPTRIPSKSPAKSSTKRPTKSPMKSPTWRPVVIPVGKAPTAAKAGKARRALAAKQQMIRGLVKLF
jgi:hypothetical protein